MSSVFPSSCDENTKISVHPLPRQARVVWLFNSIGTAESLLYWSKIFSEYLRTFPNSEFYSATTPSQTIPGTDKSVVHSGSFRIPLGWRKDSYPRRLDLASPGIIATLLRNPPDVIVVSEFLAYAAYLSLVRSWLPSTRLLMLLESDPVRGQINRNRGWKHWIRKRIAKSADLFLTNNQAGEAYLREQLGISTSRIITRPYLVSIPSQLLTSPIAPKDRRESSRTLEQSSQHPSGEGRPTRNSQSIVRFLTVGQLIPRKGMMELLRAVMKLPPQLQARMRLEIVGEGTLMGRLEDTIRENRLATQIQLRGSLNYESLAELYASADVFVMPTLDDYRALVGFEAIAHGLPMLHSRFDGAVHELIQTDPQPNGIVFDPRNTDSFAAHLEWMILHPEERERMGRISRQISQRFTISEAVNSLTFALDRCLEQVRETSNEGNSR